MTTLATPTLGRTNGLSLWRVDMRAGAHGPRHTMDSEQIWTVLTGQAAITVGTDQVVLAPGDTIVLPAAVSRQIAARSDASMVVAGHGDAVVSVDGEDVPRGTPPWIS